MQPVTPQPTFLEQIKALALKAQAFFKSQQDLAAERRQAQHDALVASGAQESRVVTYQSPADMARGIAQMTRQGWQVTGQSSYTPRKGVARTIAGGFLFFNRKPVTVVTFTRAIR